VGEDQRGRDDVREVRGMSGGRKGGTQTEIQRVQGPNEEKLGTRETEFSKDNFEKISLARKASMM